MRMYEELIKNLRIHSASCTGYPHYCDSCTEDERGCDVSLEGKSADAIEGLIDYVRQIDELRKDGYYLQKTKMMTYGQAIMTMPLPEPPKEET